MSSGKNLDQPGHASLGTYLWRAMYWFHEGLHENLRLRGITPVTRTQAQVLGNLALGEARPTRLAKFVGISPQAMSQVLAELANVGLIRLETDRADGRARVVRLTEAGLQHQAAARAILHEMETVLERQFGRAIIDVVRMVVESDWPALPQLPFDSRHAAPLAPEQPSGAVRASEAPAA